MTQERPIGINGEPLWLPSDPIEESALRAMGATEKEVDLLSGEVLGELSQADIRELDDIDKIDAARTRTALLEDRIIHGTATNEEVLTWYKSQDPLRAPQIRDGLLYGEDEERDRRIRRAILLENGAETLIINTLPQSINMSRRVFSGTTELNNAPLDLLALAKNAINENVDKKLTIEQLKPLLTASDMLDESTSILTSEPSISIILPEDYMTKMRLFSLKVNEFVTTGECTKPEDYLILGEAFIRLYSNLFFGTAKGNEGTDETFKNFRKQILKEAIKQIETIAEKVDIKANIGFFYEYLWVLDSMMFSHVTGKGNFFALPSTLFEDEPTIDYPEHNRAFDVRVVSGDKVKLIQLKATPNPKHKNYHQLIQVIKEKNFMEKNPARLRAKIRTYRKILNDEPYDKVQLFRQYAIPSVVETLNEVIAA